MDDGSLYRAITGAHAEALKVGDSPLRADRVAEELRRISGRVEGAALPEERKSRVSAALADALRVLRRDDDGREAARHLQAALSQLDPPPRRASPFADD